ncbi:MAG: hypothetical protein HFJ24_00955 [Clostridia bacterium]|nr:hypothetical protein [Clostridia bacterium]
MSIQKQKLIETIEELPEELANKVIDYMEYIKFMYVIDKAPRDIVIKDKNDLIRKLEEGMEDTDSGKVCSIEEAFEEVTEILNN